MLVLQTSRRINNIDTSTIFVDNGVKTVEFSSSDGEMLLNILVAVRYIYLKYLRYMTIFSMGRCLWTEYRAAFLGSRVPHVTWVRGVSPEGWSQPTNLCLDVVNITLQRANILHIELIHWSMQLQFQQMYISMDISIGIDDRAILQLLKYVTCV